MSRRRGSRRPVLLTPEMLSRPAEQLREYFEVEHQLHLWPPLTATIIVLLSIVFVWSGYSYTLAPSDNLIDGGQFQGAFFGTAEGLMRILTAACLHAGFEHFLGNVLLLYVAGIMLEQLYGMGTLALAYFLLLAGQGAATYFHYEPTMSTVGASGVVFGLVGFLTMFYLRDRKEIFVRYRTVALVFILLGLHSIGMGLSSLHINNAAHVGGFATDLVCGLLFRPLFARGLLDDHGRPFRPSTAGRWLRRGIFAFVAGFVLIPFGIIQSRLAPPGNISFWEQFDHLVEFLLWPRNVIASDVTYWTIRTDKPVQIKVTAKPDEPGSPTPASGAQARPGTAQTSPGGKEADADRDRPPANDQGKQCPVCRREDEACACAPGCRWTYFHHFADKECRVKLKTTVWGPNTGSPFKLGFDNAACVEYLGRCYSWSYPRTDCFAPTDAAVGDSSPTDDFNE